MVESNGTSRWRLLRTEPLCGAMNMALDEVLLDAVMSGRSAPVLRIYRWQPAAVSLGYFQKGPRAVNLGACRRLGYDVVRRLTGGRAVLHDQEVTYSVIAADSGGPFPGGILENYRVIAGALQHGLNALGLPTVLAPSRGQSHNRAVEGARQSACFTAPSRYELTCFGCKITGSSQKRQGKTFLQHGSIPLDLDCAKLFQALDTEGEMASEEGGRLLAGQIGWMNRWLPLPVSREQAEARLIASFGEVLDLELREDAVAAEEWLGAEMLVKEKYGNPQWTLRGIGPA